MGAVAVYPHPVAWQSTGGGASGEQRNSPVPEPKGDEAVVVALLPKVARVAEVDDAHPAVRRDHDVFGAEVQVDQMVCAQTSTSPHMQDCSVARRIHGLPGGGEAGTAAALPLWRHTAVNA